MDADYINLTTENIANEHLCCIIRSKKLHPGIEAKRQWHTERLKEGQVGNLHARLEKTKKLAFQSGIDNLL